VRTVQNADDNLLCEGKRVQLRYDYRNAQLKELNLVNLFAHIRNSPFYLPLLVWTHKFDRLDKSPNFGTLAISKIVKPRAKDLIIRRAAATSLPVSASKMGSPAEIELLFVTSDKDFPTLPAAILGAIASTENQIKKISVVTITSAVDACRRLLKERLPQLEVEVIDEAQVIDPRVFAQLREAFGGRYGWILQQLLTIAMAQKSKAAGVLAVDADTILLLPRNWLDKNGRQPLLVSSEFEPSYYDFLHSIGIGELKPDQTFVCHHMLFQPSILNRLALEISGTSGDRFINWLAAKAVDEHQATGRTMFCLEFELYGQYIKSFAASRVQMIKFSNRPIYDGRRLDAARSAQKFKGKYASVSMHSYDS